jgi:hypothetical protein
MVAELIVIHTTKRYVTGHTMPEIVPSIPPTPYCSATDEKADSSSKHSLPATPIPALDQLKNFTRKELQALCKRLGLKANGKVSPRLSVSVADEQSNSSLRMNPWSWN